LKERRAVTCLINPDTDGIDPDRLRVLMVSIIRARTERDLQAELDRFREELRSHVTREIRRLLEGTEFAPAYPLALGYTYVAYLDVMIARAIEGITRAPYRAGYYYPLSDCCVALEAIRSAWLHFLNSMEVPLEAHARQWAAGITYEWPCRVPDTTVFLLRAMRQYLMTLSFSLSLSSQQSQSQ
jgi:hypothetical protein